MAPSIRVFPCSIPARTIGWMSVAAGLVAVRRPTASLRQSSGRPLVAVMAHCQPVQGQLSRMHCKDGTQPPPPILIAVPSWGLPGCDPPRLRQSHLGAAIGSASVLPPCTLMQPLRCAPSVRDGGIDLAAACRVGGVADGSDGWPLDAPQLSAPPLHRSSAHNIALRLWMLNHLQIKSRTDN